MTIMSQFADVASSTCQVSCQHHHWLSGYENFVYKGLTTNLEIRNTPDIPEVFAQDLETEAS